MAFTRRKITLSPKERQLLALLPTNGDRVDTHGLIKLFYADIKEKDVPYNARSIIVSRMRSIIDKTARNNDRPKVCKSLRRGPHSIEFWLEP